MSKTKLERIEGYDDEIRQLKNRQKLLRQQYNKQERKDRTKRLIQRGAILESLIPEADTLSNEQIKAFLEKTIKSDYATKTLTMLKSQPAPEPPKKTETVPGQNSGNAAPKPIPSAEPPSGADGGRTGETARFGG